MVHVVEMSASSYIIACIELFACIIDMWYFMFSAVFAVARILPGKSIPPYNTLDPWRQASPARNAKCQISCTYSRLKELGYIEHYLGRFFNK